MELSKRLDTLFDFVSKDDVVADVGSDHGKLIISLFKKGIIKKGYAIENKKGPFTILKNAIVNNKCENKIIPLFSDGIADLTHDVNCVIIAGMGGNNIVNILNKHKEKLSNVETIIVDAHNSIPFIREEICNLGYDISKEEIIEEKNIFYEIICFKKGHEKTYSKEDYLFGPLLMKEKNDIFRKKWLKIYEKNKKLLKLTNMSDNQIKSLNSINQKIEQILMRGGTEL